MLQKNTFCQKKFQILCTGSKVPFWQFGNFSKIHAGKSTKRGFSKKAIVKIEIFLLFLVPMNLSKAWNTKLEAGSFFAV